ncbi:hypothetical protein OLX23_25640 [Novosphingobium sp. JCM 18896]|nr:hypothetical protein [Novosphingobium sp. JCM 18896]
MDDAIEVLHAASLRADEGPQTGADVRLALKTLRFVGVPAEAIRYFWDSCQTENAIGRAQGMTAALNRIKLIREGRLELQPRHRSPPQSTPKQKPPSSR